MSNRKTLSIPKLEDMRLALELFTVSKHKKSCHQYQYFVLRQPILKIKRQSRLDTSSMFNFNGPFIVKFLLKNVRVYLPLS